MPKRTRSDNLEDEFDRLAKKMRKLEKRIRMRDEIPEEQSVPPVPPPDLYQEEAPPPDLYQEELSSERDELSSDLSQEVVAPDSPDIQEAPLEVTADIHAAADDDARPMRQEVPLENSHTSKQPNVLGDNACTSKEDPQNAVTTETSVEVELDEDILEILGEDPSSLVKHGPEIRIELASRFQHIATEELSKEARKELINKYPLPANCIHVGAPAINPEIKAALEEKVVKRDRGMESKQKEMSSAISCLTEIISMHLASKEKNNEMLQKLMDVGRILCDIQHGDSITRRSFVLSTVKSNMQEHLKNTKIDTFLFGDKLSETLKSAKAVNKSGAELKLDSTKMTKKPKPQAQQALNRKAAPQMRRQQGAAYAPRGRDREPATTRWQPPPPPLQPMTSYKRSSTQPPQSVRRRQ